MYQTSSLQRTQTEAKPLQIQVSSLQRTPSEAPIRYSEGKFATANKSIQLPGLFATPFATANHSLQRMKVRCSELCKTAKTQKRIWGPQAPNFNMHPLLIK